MKRIYTPLQICFLLILLVACEKFTEPLAFAPEFKLNEASDVSRLSAVISGKITPNGGEIREYGFVYGEYENLANATEVAFEGNPSGEVVTQLYNLDPDTKYYYQLYAGSGVTRVSSEVKSFTTNASDAPKMTKVVELDKNEQSVTVSCQLTDDGGYDVIMMGIAYRRSDSQKYSMTIYDEPTTESFTLTVDGLEAGTSYYVCGFAISRGGIGYGAETGITTEDSEAPVVTTGSIVEYGGSWLIANAQQLSEGFSPVVERGFCYSSTSTMPTLTDGYVTAEGTANELFSAKITGLQSATTYYVRAYARNGTKVGYGKVVEVTTKQLTAPTFSDVTIEDVTAHSFRLLATVSNGNGIIQEKGVCWSVVNVNPEKSDNFLAAEDITSGTLDVSVNKLEHNTQYYVRPYAINEAGISYGEVVTVTTLIDPVPGEDDNVSPEM